MSILSIILSIRRIFTKVNLRLNTSSFCQEKRSDDEILGVASNAEEKEIKRAYHGVLRKYHPSQYGVKYDSEITENYIQKKVAYLSLMYEEKTWWKRLKHRFDKTAIYVTSFLCAVGIYESLRYGLAEVYRRINPVTSPKNRLS